jgi:hypothetical protein
LRAIRQEPGQEADALQLKNELGRLALEEFASSISRTGGFPNKRLYSRLNREELS